MEVLLKSCGNIDHDEDPYLPKPGVRTGWLKVDTLEQAVTVCRNYIKENDLGSGNWIGGKVLNSKGLLIGEIAYNGSFFKEGN